MSNLSHPQARSAVSRHARLDLGCGPLKRGPEYVGIDLLDLPGVDLVGDVFDHLEAMPDGWISEVFSSHFLEHLENPGDLLAAAARVLEPGGRLEIVVPHFSNPYYYSDVTHRRPFGLYTLCYLVHSSLFKRAVPRYGAPLPLELERVHLTFKSPRPFYGRYAAKRTLGALVNAHRATQEFYEENLAWVIPCYEVRYTLTRM